MTPVVRRSIRRKLMRLAFLSAASALLLAGIMFLVFEYYAHRTSQAQRLSSNASIIEANVASALVFNDPSSAEATLAAFRGRPSIVSAGVYRKDGRPFAFWNRDRNAGEAPALPENREALDRYAPDSIEVFRPLQFNGDVIGMVYVKSDMSEVTKRTAQFAGLVAAALGVSLLFVYPIASRVAEKISRPIVDLLKTARAVSEEKDFSVRATSTSDDEIGVLVHAFNEMLARIRASGEALRQSHAELEQRVKDRTHQLEAANKELEAFSYSVSHDLRAPLRAVDGFSRAVLEDHGGVLPDQGKSDLERIIKAAGNMAQLIDDMLNLSRVSRSEVVKDKIDLVELAAPVVAELQRSSRNRTVEFVAPPSLEASGDSRLLTIVLENLLSNAWKFTSKTEGARVEIGAVSTENGERAFFVKDNGAGFDMNYAGKLFSVFQRLHRPEEFPGTGVGLATVQRIVHKHGGRVWAEGRPKAGATFFFTL